MSFVVVVATGEGLRKGLGDGLGEGLGDGLGEGLDEVPPPQPQHA